MRFNSSRLRCPLTGWNNPRRFFLFFITALVFISFPTPLFSKGSQEHNNSALRTFVSIAPQAYLLQRIGGNRVSVGVLVQEGQDPHIFDPTPSTMARLSEADLYFRIGVEFEQALLERIATAAPELEIIDCRENIILREIEMDDAHEADHHEEHDGADPHIWMSVRNTITISTTIYKALVDLDPEGRSVYQEGYDSLVNELISLDNELTRILEPVKGRKLFVFHPAFGYFAHDYGLHQVAVEIGGNEPSARQLAQVIDEAKNQGARVIFVQPQFSRKSAQAVADAIEGAVVPIDSLAMDYIENMKTIAVAVEEGLQ